MAAIIGIVQEQAQRMFFFILSMHGDGDFRFPYPAPSLAARESSPSLNPRSRSPTPLRGGWAAAAACFLCVLQHREYSPAVPIIVLGDIKAKLTGKMAASAVLTLIYLILSVESPIYLALGVRERAESAHAPCEPFCLLFSLRPPDSGAGQYLYLRVAKCGRLWADS